MKRPKSPRGVLCPGVPLPHQNVLCPTATGVSYCNWGVLCPVCPSPAVSRVSFPDDPYRVRPKSRELSPPGRAVSWGSFQAAMILTKFSQNLENVPHRGVLCPGVPFPRNCRRSVIALVNRSRVPH
jgi:hypothetical protein